ncbi:SDR family oxidoreductase [Seonamhaeicola sp. MEBiC1930]|uniref:SDR family oxidoreductase n=1 Tax=Seonamhaeicola sp. MEBiC01930 TaxID=2976768 RepID=UPI003243325A
MFLVIFICSIAGFVQAQNTEANKSVLITGANRGLGLELCKQFIKDGYTVYGTARKPSEAVELKATGSIVLQLDVTSEESIEALAESLKGKPLDILINNAGYFGPNKIGTKMDNIHNLTRKEIEMCFAVNTMGPIFVTQALLPNLEMGDTKKIINMSTRSSIISNARGGAWGYRVSKAGLNMVTSTLHGELYKKGFIVVSVAPGHNKTDMGTERGKLMPEESMPLLKKVIEELTPEQSSGFWYYNGKELPW